MNKTSTTISFREKTDETKNGEKIMFYSFFEGVWLSSSFVFFVSLMSHYLK